jgi:acetylglutamate kinase
MDISNISMLVGALPYIQRHRGKTFVVKMGGEIARDPQTLERVSKDIALCVNVGIKLVVVHGGGPQVTEMSRSLGIETQVIGGRRVTDDETLRVAKMVFAGVINIDIASALRRQGLHAVGISGVAGRVIQATKRPAQEVTDPKTGDKRVVDFGHVGDIQAVDAHLLHTLLVADYVPVLSSLGGDDHGNVYNINADTVAARIAQELKAEKLIVLSDVAGLLANPDDPTSRVSEVSLPRCEEMIASGAIRGGMLPKITALMNAVKLGVKRAHILSGTAPHGLLVELFTKDGSGTLVTSNEEEKRYLSE